jgi:G3E family GTPase
VITARIRAINSLAEILPTVQARVPLTKLLDLHAFDLDRILDLDIGFLKDRSHQHEPTISSAAFECEGVRCAYRTHTHVDDDVRKRIQSVWRSGWDV